MQHPLIGCLVFDGDSDRSVPHARGISNEEAFLAALGDEFRGGALRIASFNGNAPGRVGADVFC